MEGALLVLDQMPGMGFVPNLVSFLKHLTVYLHWNILFSFRVCWRRKSKNKQKERYRNLLVSLQKIRLYFVTVFVFYFQKLVFENLKKK